MTISGITMQQYLGTSKDAVEQLIQAINSLTFKSFCNETTREYERYRLDLVKKSSDLEDDDFTKLFQEKMMEKIAESSKIISENDLSLNKDEFNSFSFIAESLLQLARHSLSIIHGNFSTCRRNFTSLRSIVSISNPPFDIFDVIWAARNQAMHFDEIKSSPDLSKPAEVHMHEVFNWLATLKREDFIEDIKFEPTVFSKFNSGEHNLAYQIIQTLGWNSYELFKTDMESLA